MGIEKYEGFVRRAKTTLTYDSGWSLDNQTGSWRSVRPVVDKERCNACDICWLFCPEDCISRGSIEIDATYCKGCGICAQECNRGAIKMEREPG